MPRYHRHAMIPMVAAALFGLPCQAYAKDVNEDRGYIEAYVSGVTASGQASDGSEDTDKSGGIYGMNLSWDRDSGDDRFGLDLSTTYFVYSDPAKENRWSNRIAGSWRHDTGADSSLAVLGDFTSQMSTLESSEADQIQARGRITFEPGQHRFRLTGGWRWRDYRDRPDYSGNGPVIGADYRLRLGDGEFLSFEGQYEEIVSDLPSRSYRRSTAAIEYRKPINRSVDLVAGLRYRDWTYPGRLIGADTQHDHSWSPEFELSYEFARDWSVGLGGVIIWRSSNDPGYEETVKRGVITLRKRIRL